MRLPDKVNRNGLMFSAAMMAAAILIACGGCASMTPRQHFYMGQYGADLGSTYYALEVDGRFEEANPSADGIEEVIVMKLVVTGIVEGLARLRPEQADTLYKIGAFIGYGAGVFNTYQVVSR